MRSLSQSLQQRILSAAGTARVMVEPRIEGAVDLRQRADQWTACDGGLPANLEVLADGGVRLKATAGAAVGPNVVTSGTTYFRAFETGIVGPWIDPLSNLNASPPRVIVGARVQWTGNQVNNSYGSIQAYLHPRFDPTKAQYVQTWALELYQILVVDTDEGTGKAIWRLVPLLTSTAFAAEGAGFVVFTLQDATGKSAPFHPNPYSTPAGGEGGPQTGDYLVLCHGYDAKGNPATNTGWGYDSGNNTFASGAAPNQLTIKGQSVQPIFTASAPPGSTAEEGALSLLPAIQFVPVAFAASATLTFKTGMPINLVATPTIAPEFVGRAETPAGTSVTFQAAVDPAGAFTTYKDGQTAADIGIATQQKYDMQVTLTASAAGDRTPIVRGIGARVVTRADFGDVAEVVSWNEQTDPITHKSEVEECTIRVIHDGVRDYRDAISLLLAQNPPGKFYFRVSIGDRALPRDQWLHLDDFFPDDEQLEGAYVDLPCVSSLSLLRQALPVLQSDAVAVPTADSANPGAWTASTGTLLYPQIADVASDLTGGLPNDTTYIQSPVNPANADYVATLGGIATPGQTVGATMQWRAAVAAGGQSLSLQVTLLEGASVRASRQVTVNVADAGQGSYTPSSFLLTPTEQAAIGNWSNLTMRFRANGTGQIRVGWARLVVLGRRAPLQYPPQVSPATLANVMNDLVQNQVALDGRYQGPRYQDTTPAVTVGKTIAAQASGSTDLTRAKTELDALAWIAGGCFISSQGRVVYKPLYTVAVATDLITGSVTAQYAPLVGPIRAIFPIEEVEPLAVTAGWRQRLPLFAVPWGWDGSRYGGEVQVTNAAALSFYAQSLIDPEVRCPTETALWIAGEGTARGLATRHAQSFGLGLLVWRFRTTYARPELERGDVVVVATDQFVAYDPIANRAILGKVWATGVIVGRYDAFGREWAVWIQSLSAIRPVASALAYPSVNPQHPLALGVTGYVGEAAGTPAGDNLNIFWSGTSAVASVKIAVGTTLQAAGTGTLFVGNQGTALITGPFAFGVTQFVTITPYATVDGSGAAGVAAFVVKLIDGSSISTPYNNQGSIPPYVTPTSPLTYAGVFSTNAGESTISWTWPAFTLYRPDGSNVSVPASSSFAAAPTPTLSQVPGGGIGATTYYVRLAYVKNGLICFPGAEASFAVAANNLLKVSSPPSVAGYDGWVPLIGTVAGATRVLGSGAPNGCPWLTWIPFGTDYTEPTTGLNGIGTQPYLTQWTGAITDTWLASGTTTYYYPYWDTINSIIAFAAWSSNKAHGQTSNAGDPVAAREAWGDGHMGLLGAPGNVMSAATTPVNGGGSPNSGSGGGTGTRYK